MRGDFIIQDGVAEIPLRARGGAIVAFARVDIDDAETLGQHRWWRHHRRGYAVRTVYETVNGKRRGIMVMMHREVLGLPRKKGRGGLLGDHINRDVLDNRRGNLRAVTDSESLQNRTPYRMQRVPDDPCPHCGGTGARQGD